jgi:hypothetical protein
MKGLLAPPEMHVHSIFCGLGFVAETEVENCGLAVRGQPKG